MVTAWLETGQSGGVLRDTGLWASVPWCPYDPRELLELWPAS
jgi:hypothetical protein